MLKLLLCLLIGVGGLLPAAYAQTLDDATAAAAGRRADSLTRVLATVTDDSTRAQLLADLCQEERDARRDTAAARTAVQAERAAQRAHLPAVQLDALQIQYYLLLDQNRYDEALAQMFPALRVAEHAGDTAWQCTVLGDIAVIYRDQGQYAIALGYQRRTVELAKAARLKEELGEALLFFADTYADAGRPDLALKPAKQAYDLLHNLPNDPYRYLVGITLAQALLRSGQDAKALPYLYYGLAGARRVGFTSDQALAYQVLAQLHARGGRPDSVRFYGERGLAAARIGNYASVRLELGQLLSQYYETHHDAARARACYEEAQQAQKAIHDDNRTRRTPLLSYAAYEQQRAAAVADLHAAHTRRQYTRWIGLGGGLLIGSTLLALLIWRRRSRRLSHG